ncbi:MAG: 50S ribosomal protein L18 [Proteobacteria bacterium]|jgi:large subunit ribosomal protein L18|nr:50S ribosomal protein L18 [Pseudomonadota bacterium]
MINNYQRRKFRIRNSVIANNKSGRPRIVVARKNKNIYAQLLDLSGNVLASCSTLTVKDDNYKTGMEKAKLVGISFAKSCLEKGFDFVVFDKGAYVYNGRIKALADSCREQGLKF